MSRKGEALIIAGTMAGCTMVGCAPQDSHNHEVASEMLEVSPQPAGGVEGLSNDWRRTINMLGGWAFMACQDRANACTRTINVDPADTRPLSEANGISNIKVTSPDGVSTVVVEGVHLENPKNRWVERIDTEYTHEGVDTTAWVDQEAFSLNRTDSVSGALYQRSRGEVAKAASVNTIQVRDSLVAAFDSFGLPE